MRFYACAVAIILWCNFGGPASAQTYEREGSWGVKVEGGGCVAFGYDEEDRSAIYLMAKPGGKVFVGLLNDKWTTVHGQRYPNLDLFLGGDSSKFYPNLTSFGVVEGENLRGHLFELDDRFLDLLAVASDIAVNGEGQTFEGRLEVGDVGPTIADLRLCRAEMTAE